MSFEGKTWGYAYNMTNSDYNTDGLAGRVHLGFGTLAGMHPRDELGALRVHNVPAPVRDHRMPSPRDSTSS